MSAFPVLLFAASVAGWVVVTDAAPSAHAYIRFACILCAALATAELVDAHLADSVVLIVAAIAPALLAIAVQSVFRAPVSSSLAGLILAVCSVAGMVAAATDLALVAFGPLSVAVLAMMVTALRRFRDLGLRSIQAMASAIALLAGASAYAGGGTGAHPAFVLFVAAGLLGTALALAQRSDAAVEEKAASDLRSAPVGRLR